jgi:hypothetical protein
MAPRYVHHVDTDGTVFILVHGAEDYHPETDSGRYIFVASPDGIVLLVPRRTTLRSRLFKMPQRQDPSKKEKMEEISRFRLGNQSCFTEIFKQIMGHGDPGMRRGASIAKIVAAVERLERMQRMSGFHGRGMSLPTTTSLHAWATEDARIVFFNAEGTPEVTTSSDPSSLGEVTHYGLAFIELRDVHSFATAYVKAEARGEPLTHDAVKIHAYHFTTQNTNREDFRYESRRNRFKFGIPLLRCVLDIRTTMDDLLAQRPYVLGFHDASGDIKRWTALNLQHQPLWMIDTRDLLQVVKPTTAETYGRCIPSLLDLVSATRIQPEGQIEIPKGFYHIAGNDAFFSVKAMAASLAQYVRREGDGYGNRREREAYLYLPCTRGLLAALDSVGEQQIEDAIHRYLAADLGQNAVLKSVLGKRQCPFTDEARKSDAADEDDSKDGQASEEMDKPERSRLELVACRETTCGYLIIR